MNTAEVPHAQLTHVGVYVHDMDKMIDFYRHLLGFVVADRGEHLGRHLAFLTRSTNEHHQMVFVSGRTAPADTKLLGQLSFRCGGLDDLRALSMLAERSGVTDLDARNHGNSWSVYLTDPENNVVEIYTPTPWHVSQPRRFALDLSASNAEIEATTREAIEHEPSFRTMADWRADMAQRLHQSGGDTVAGRTGDVEASGYQSLWTALRQVEFKQGYVDAGGVRTRYAEAGSADAPAVMLLHGTGGHWETWARNLGAYSKHFRTIAIDMVGNGFSDRPDLGYEIPVYVRHLADVMDALRTDKASFVGTSLGSWVAAAFAVAHPTRVHKLVLLSPAGLVATAENMARIKAQRTAAVENPTWSTIKAMFDHLLADESDRLADLIALRQAIYRQPGMVRTMENTLVLQEPEIRDRNLLTEAQWRSITAPTMAVASGKDYSEYSNTSRQVAALMPNAHLVEMPNVKHWPHFEDAETFNAISIPFLLA